jgi:hypothetical protein
MDQKWAYGIVATNAIFGSNQSQTAIGSGDESQPTPGKMDPAHVMHPTGLQPMPVRAVIRNDDLQRRSVTTLGATEAARAAPGFLSLKAPDLRS